MIESQYVFEMTPSAFLVVVAWLLLYIMIIRRSCISSIINNRNSDIPIIRNIILRHILIITTIKVLVLYFFVSFLS